MALVLSVVLVMFGGCRIQSRSKTGENSEGSRLVVWSFTDELGGMIDNYYRAAHRDVTLDFFMTPTAQFTEKLDPTLASGIRTPDVFALEDAFVRKYVESGLLLDITDVYNANKDKLLAYPVQVGSFDGKVYGMSWQATPGALFYRRSLARKYLGTDDPAQVQSYFSDIGTFLNTAALLKSRSNGACVVVPGHSELLRPFLSSRKQPWVVNKALAVDPAVEQYMEMSKTLHDQGFEAGADQWSDDWVAGMKGALTDSRGNGVEVFSYFLPTWGLHYVLKADSPETSGDWAMIPGPVPYRWGGTWIGAWKHTKNPEAAKELIRYLTADDAFLEAYAKDSGDLVSNTRVVDKIKGSYSDPFLAGQNHYAEFAKMAERVDGRLTQGSDQYIESIFTTEAAAYTNGEKTKAQALADFREKVAKQIGY
jgi:ABC-type glycerol-3-phosphate transport system substrate-binding protein